MNRPPVPFTAKDPIPARAGVGFKLEHSAEIIEGHPDVGWFEVHAENCMEEGGPPHHYLSAIRQSYPVSVHGVGLSIGADAPLDREHLSRLKAVCDRYQPGLVSEHLAWSTLDRVYLNDLLPIPYDRATLRRVSEHIDEVQTYLGRQILIENPSTYLRFKSDRMPEVEFLAAIVDVTGCGLLLDVNNVFISTTNQAHDAAAYIDSFPIEHVAEIHLGGYANDGDDADAPLLIDTHGSQVAAPVWALYERVIARGGPKPTLIEWDNEIPAWAILHAEAQQADRVLARRAQDDQAA